MKLSRYRSNPSLLWHGFFWEMTRVYGKAIDPRHFEVLLTSLCRTDLVTLRAAISANSRGSFFGGAGFEGALAVLTRAAVSGDMASRVDRLTSRKSKLMLAKCQE